MICESSVSVSNCIDGQLTVQERVGVNVSATSCVSNLARPQILLKPPVPSGVFEVDEGSSVRRLVCTVDNQLTHPDVSRIETST